jgi:hypothetical protein
MPDGEVRVEIVSGSIGGLTAAAFALRGWTVQRHVGQSQIREAGAGIYIAEKWPAAL